MGIKNRIYYKLLINWIDLVWRFVQNFMPKTYERWNREIEEQNAEDFWNDYSNEMFWQQQNGR